jgi:type I restriction enzyme M protein
MISLMQPRLGEVIQDPSAGTGGFLIAANHYIREHNDIEALDQQGYKAYRRQFHGMELVQDTHRLGLMNLMLHDLESDENSGIRFGDTLSSDGQQLPKADLILSNPPFGTKKGGGLPTRDDFTYPTSNKQLAFLQHIYRALKPGGRAAVVLPDNVLFEANVGRQVRVDLMEKCNLHTILRLPTGIFYAQGVKTNVLFFTRGAKDKGNTNEVWVYDLRANMAQFGKRTQLKRQHFKEFEAAYGKEKPGSSENLAEREESVDGRFRKFTREWIAERGDDLNIAWIKDESDAEIGAMSEPADLAREALAEFEEAFDELRSILAELGEDVEVEIAQ